jgi:site-specific DNA recombinase
MLAAIQAGGADVLVAWHVDRLTRKLTDLEHLIELTERSSLRIATVSGDLDLSNDQGRLVGRILASVARGEVERKGARQKRARQQAAEQGRPTGGRRAFGYGPDGVTVAEDEARLIRRAYADLLDGKSLKGMARTWNEAGHTTTAGNAWNHGNVRGVLLNPRYAGLSTYQGEVVGPAVWEALVDEGTHAAAAAVLRLPERRTTTSTARKYLLPGLALCWKCGSDVATGHTRHGKRVYVCRDKKCVSRKADAVDELVESVVVARLSRLDVTSVLSQGDVAQHDELRQQAGVIQGRLDDLALGIEEGILSLSTARQAQRRLRVELDRLHEEMAAGVRVEAVRSLVGAEDVTAAWGRLELAQKRAVIDALMTITLLKPEGGTRAFDPRTVEIEWKVG